MQIDFLKKVMMSDSEYWVLKKEGIENHLTKEINEGGVFFVAILKETKKYDEIMLKDLELLANTEIITNVCLSKNYPPFQLYQFVKDFYDGFEIKENINQFFKEAINLKSKDYYDYYNLYEKICEK